MLLVQVWLVTTGSLLALLLLVIGVQAVWGLLRSGRGAVAPDVVAVDSAPAEPMLAGAVPCQPAALEPAARPMVGSTAA